MLRLKELALMAGLMFGAAAPSCAATVELTTYYAGDGSGFGFSYFGDTSYSTSSRTLALPQFDPAIGRGSILTSVLIEFYGYAEAGGGYICDSEGNSDVFSNNLSVSVLGSSFSVGGPFLLPCRGPDEAIDFQAPSPRLYGLLEFSSDRDDLSPFLGLGIIPLSVTYGGGVTYSEFTYLVDYGFTPIFGPVPVPLPATGGMLLLPLLGIAAARRKRRIARDVGVAPT